MKLPAYGKSLLAARFQGGHPELIQVIYGEDWTPERQDAPLLAVKSQEFAPGIYDWRCVTEVWVEVIHRAEMPLDWTRAGVCFMAAELAEWSPCVNISFSDGSFNGVRSLAFACRVAGRWPAWWSERLDQEYGRRQEAYFTERIRRIAA